MDKYDEMAKGLIASADISVYSPINLVRNQFAKALRECAAQAFEEAASDIECFDSQYAPAFIKDKDCPPCDDCVKGARLRGKAASLRSPHADKPKPCRHVTPNEPNLYSPCPECGYCSPNVAQFYSPSCAKPETKEERP